MPNDGNKFEKILKEMVDENLEVNRKFFKNMHKELDKKLTPDEMAYYDKGDYCQILPLLFLLEGASQTGVLLLQSTNEIEKDFGDLGWDDVNHPELQRYITTLQNTWNDILGEYEQ